MLTLTFEAGRIRDINGERVIYLPSYGGRVIFVALYEYHIANLRAVLEAALMAMPEVPSSPLAVIDTGDWAGELLNHLPHVDHGPNVDARSLAIMANKIAQ